MPDRFIPLPEVLRLTSLSRSTLYDGVKRKTFPAPIGLGGRRVAWLEHDVLAWIANRVTIARTGQAV